MNVLSILIFFFVVSGLSHDQQQTSYHPDLEELLLLMNDENSSTNTIGSRCHPIWIEKTSANVLCCHMKNAIKCLPSFIVAGSQKSGTTVAAALLSSLQGISFSKKKEVHFFDNTKRYNQGIAKYLSYFHAWNYSEPDQFYPPMYGESTPFYIASRDACQRISETVPGVRIIILLRDPISRAYSEYQMKKRRVDSQNEFLALAHNHSDVLHQCLVDHPWKWKTIKACLPSALPLHDHFAKFMIAIRKHAYATTNDTTNSTDMNDTNNNTTGWSSMIRICFPINSNTSAVATKQAEVAHRKTSQKKGKRLLSLKKRLLKAASNNRDHGVLQQIHSDDEDVTEGNVPSTISVTFAAIDCLGKHASEKLSPLGVAFGRELRDFEKCAGDLVGTTRFGMMTLRSLDAAVDKCLRISKGISKDYVYRSMYAAQLFHCFKFIPRTQFLILSSEDLELHPLDTLKQMLHFIGRTTEQPELQSTVSVSIDGSVSPSLVLGHHDDTSNQIVDFDASFVSKAVKHFFPTFESSTGWRLRSEYDSMPHLLHLELRHFFAPYNRLLSQLLGNDAFERTWAKTPYDYSNTTSFT